MPLYLCNAHAGVIPEAAKAKIAKDITDIHCEQTDAPPTFVHAFFFEDAPMPPLGNATVHLHGNIRAGRDDATKEEIVKQMRQSVARHSGIALENITMSTQDVPAHWVMEGGDLLPEPGEEAAWLEAHEAKLKAEAAQ
ncbi:hypothetical protein [Alterisphingorhabdus coralli]|uniref:Tautomerase cis-CaaD-like domain-containing protein n=1 Tax=Alterisphingorhabdus coralli TaxID=3071408 RepID=A0AA97I1B3_9SPHN|nr:hypothetical protein [Parasphingorhabdus sp. SCSIO 66989]WOE75213.1 hypothetical protein RB602_00395 [Parasphingorhabdus sp. SCSIO 66989]